MAEPVLAPLTQMRGTARLTRCPECGEPHGITYRLGQTQTVECASLPPREMRLYLDAAPPTIVVGALLPSPFAPVKDLDPGDTGPEPTAPTPDKKPRRPA